MRSAFYAKEAADLFAYMTDDASKVLVHYSYSLEALILALGGLWDLSLLDGFKFWDSLPNRRYWH